MAERFVSIEVTKVILRLNYGVFPAASPRPSRPAAAPACGDIVRVELSLTGARPDPLDVRLIALSAHGEARPVCADRMGPLDMQLALGGDSPGDLDRAGPLDVQLALGGTRAGDLVTVSLAPLARGPPALQPAARRPAPAAAAHAPDGAAKSAVQLRLEGEAAKHGLRSLVFARVPSDYYEQPLEWRAEVLGAPSVAHLCKSIIMENTRFRPGESGLAPVVDGRVKYVLVVVQYIAKLHRERLTEAVRAFEGPGADGKKQVCAHARTRRASGPAARRARLTRRAAAARTPPGAVQHAADRRRALG